MGLDYRVRCCPDGLVTDRRRRIKVLDCTIRDGGICNGWDFSDELVQRTFRALTASGIDTMEIGYRTGEGAFDRDAVGPWRFCDEEDLARVVQPGDMTLCTMVDVGRVGPEKFARRPNFRPGPRQAPPRLPVARPLRSSRPALLS